MKVRVLGCSGAIAKSCRTTSFLIDDDILIDAGTGVGDLILEDMARVEWVLLTHSHLDHIAALPLMVDSIAGFRRSPIKVMALPETIAALKAHVFNGVIWPDFSRIPTPESPLVCFHEIAVGQRLHLGGKEIEVLPAVHTVPAVGYAASAGGSAWVFSGDTGSNPAFWNRINKMDVGMLVIETAFSNRESDLARRSLHLSPGSLAGELDRIDPGKTYPIYITHTKPAESELIMAEVQELGHAEGEEGDRLFDLRWLHAGQVFEI